MKNVSCNQTEKQHCQRCDCVCLCALVPFLCNFYWDDQQATRNGIVVKTRLEKPKTESRSSRSNESVRWNLQLLDAVIAFSFALALRVSSSHFRFVAIRFASKSVACRLTTCSCYRESTQHFQIVSIFLDDFPSSNCFFYARRFNRKFCLMCALQQTKDYL